MQAADLFTTDQTLTIALLKAKELLITTSSIDTAEAEISALHLLAAATDINYRELPLMTDRTLLPHEISTYIEYLERRIKHEPLQYILGNWDFMDFEVQIREPLLCPRPETEELVERVIREIQNTLNFTTTGRRTTERNDLIRVLDVGCGTGVIGIALARAFPDRIQVTAIDYSPIAVETSNLNARLLGLKIPDQYMAMESSIQEFGCNEDCYNVEELQLSFDYIISNPPYIPKADMETLSKDVFDYEDHAALCGGHDGLDIVKEILRKAKLLTRDNAKIFMEVDTSHNKMIESWVEENQDELGVKFVNCYKDFCDRDRFVELQAV